ncbi:enoyl-CoA hydratase-related protein [Pseudoduganella namucuonensis]|uniref:Acetyl-CoA C-acetyltransferase n=1 Tax=Pseudoduganella namucuonensis TaxID=1035707 RepID=A0A1I7KRZ1_9BURK|nr:enoyl-CoA hydratase-related protein [Pseudoduganella namucuonensis]SFV00232.1 acetyl-CoA C-acetyltransferase [Pseudoduganella namucuonensis]
MTPRSAGRIPVIIGIGELIDKPADPLRGLEPLEMLLRCAAGADADAGGGWLRRIDTLRVVNQISWPYRDLGGLLAKRLRLRAAECIHGPVGGETPVRMMLDAAVDIARGESEVALLCGAEAFKSAMALRARGVKPAWTDEDPGHRLPRGEDFVTRLAARYGLTNAVDVYPLYDNATRAAWGQSFADAQMESGTIWANMSRAAAANPYAWSGKPMSAADIVSPSEHNRPIAHPYQKFMVAQSGVNQAAAVLMTHLDAARAMGVPDERIVYVGSGAGAHEPHDFLARDRYDHAPAMELVLRRTLELNGVAARDIDLFELYSCFPCVPKLARRALGLAADGPLSVAGGLTFFGGPGNNYMTHAITAMVRALRGGQGRAGLLHGNGEYVTKHHAAMLFAAAPAHPVRNEDLQAAVEASYGPVPALVEDYEGPCAIETYTATFSRKGEPDRGVVIARTPDGRRLAARVGAADPDTLAVLVDATREPVGTPGHAYLRGDGLVHFSLSANPERIEPAVRFEKLTPHIALVTLNRPDKRNAVDGAVTRLMVRYVEQTENDTEIRVVILAAAGTAAFCAGADLAELAAGRGQETTAGGNGFGGFVHARRGKPWIAAVQASAMGGGTEFVLACDLAVAGESATFGLPEVRRGVIAAAGGVYRLARAIPQRKAMELVLTGDSLTAREAQALHLVNRVTADDQVMTEALALARRIADNAPLAVAESRRLAGAAFDGTDAELGERGVEAAYRLMATEDFKEGPRAFFEKRRPQWQGR